MLSQFCVNPIVNKEKPRAPHWRTEDTCSEELILFRFGFLDVSGVHCFHPPPVEVDNARTENYTEIDCAESEND